VTRRPILRVGLTGGIASGKTTVAGMFAEHGAFVLDADAIAHEAIARGTPAHAAIVGRFGARVLDADGAVSRPALGRIVFSDRSALADLNAIVHPYVIRELERRLARYLTTGHANVAIVDAALLVETGLHEDLDRIVVVTCSVDTQVRRLVVRSGLTEHEAAVRIAAQAPVGDKLAVAHYVIDTDATLRQTREQVDRVWAALSADFDRVYGDARS